MKHTKKLIMCIGSVAVLLCAACQKTPEVDYVTNKEGQDSLISDHEVYDTGVLIAEQCGAPEYVTRDRMDIGEYTSLSIDASVTVPNQTAIPVYQLEPKRFGEEQIRELTNIFYPDGNYINSLREKEYSGTLEELQTIIEEVTDNLEHIKVSESGELVTDDNGFVIEMGQEEYDGIKEYLDECKMIYAELLKEQNQNEDRQEISYEMETLNRNIYLGEDRTIPYQYDVAGFMGDVNGMKYRLFISQDDRNSMIVYRLDNKEMLKSGTMNVMVSRENRHYSGKDNKCQYSYEEAKEIAIEFVDKLGITNLELGHADSIELVTYNTDFETEEPTTSKELLGEKGYGFFFYRGYNDMDDAFMAVHDRRIAETSAYGSDAYEMLMQQEAYDNLDENMDQPIDIMHRELVYVVVLDDGITNLVIMNPMIEKCQMAENVNLLSFDKVVDQAVAQIEAECGDWGTKGNYERIKVQSIELNYARMQSPDNKLEYSYIPVWDFKSGPEGYIYVSINAIDGTVFNRETGH